MIYFQTGEVVKIIQSSQQLQEVLVRFADNSTLPVINYPDLTGSLEIGNRVVVNVTATKLNLGTGGYGFALWNLSNHFSGDRANKGHIMKLRYTPLQFASLSTEELDSPYHLKIKTRTSLNNIPVIVGSLHSQLPAIVLSLKYLHPKARIAYIATEGGALPIVFSQIVRLLKQKRLVEATISTGQTFGGDFESVNIYSALQIAKEIVEANYVVALMGPGGVGTNTELGHTAVEQAEIANAVKAMGGKPIAAVRISFADQRQRHQGVSHHCLTSLGELTLARCIVATPQLPLAQSRKVETQLRQAKIDLKHDIRQVKADFVIELLKNSDFSQIKTMGRGIELEAAFFKAAAAAAMVAYQEINN